MTQRERLVELIKDKANCICDDCKFGENYFFEKNVSENRCFSERVETLADHLLGNGVTVNPVKAGNPVYFVEFDDETERWEIFESEIMDVCEHGFFIPCCLGAKKDDPLTWDFQLWDDEDTFFSSEEAKKALAERNGKDVSKTM